MEGGGDSRGMFLKEVLLLYVWLQHGRSGEYKSRSSVPRHEIVAIVHTFYPAIVTFFESEEGKRESKEWKKGRTKGKEKTWRTVGTTKALADRGHSTARKGFFCFFALKFGYSIETKNPNASPIRKAFGWFVCGTSVHNRPNITAQCRGGRNIFPKYRKRLCLQGIL